MAIRLGLLGQSLQHSFSASYFSEKFEREHIYGTYENFELPSIDMLPQWLSAHESLNGFNVTIPYKQTILPYLDTVSDAAQSIGAVNVVEIVRSGQQVLLKGYNTDAIAFKLSLSPLLKGDTHKALLLGATGGAAKAVKYALTQLAIPFTSVSRDASHSEMITYSDIDAQLIREHSLIVNCSPLGMYPHIDTFPPIPYEELTHEHLLYDLVYNPTATIFLQKGQQQHCTCKNGLEMLHIQAEEAWKIWTKHRPCKTPQ